MADKKWPESWQEVNPGCLVFRPGSARDYHTGSWRALRPVCDNAKCIKCEAVMIPKPHYNHSTESNSLICTQCGYTWTEQPQEQTKEP